MAAVLSPLSEAVMTALVSVATGVVAMENGALSVAPAAIVTVAGGVALGSEDQVILALPPWEIGRLMPNLPVPDKFEPILNSHYRLAGLERPRFIGFIGALAQWALVRSSHVSVTVSAAKVA